MWSTADGAVKPEVARRLEGQLLHEESRLEHRQQLGHLPGSARARGLHLGHRSFECDPTLPPDGEEMSGARRAIETIQNVFRHSLGTCFTSVTQPRSQLLRVGHASHRDEGCRRERIARRPFSVLFTARSALRSFTLLARRLALTILSRRALKGRFRITLTHTSAVFLRMHAKHGG